MPRNDRPGSLDAVYAEEADTYFLTMNGRLRPSQLQPGQVAMSINGRMGLDGAWQPRKGVDAFGDAVLAHPRQGHVDNLCDFLIVSDTR